ADPPAPEPQPPALKPSSPPAPAPAPPAPPPPAAPAAMPGSAVAEADALDQAARALLEKGDAAGAVKALRGAVAAAGRALGPDSTALADWLMWSADHWSETQ